MEHQEESGDAFPWGWPWEAQSSPRVARESWGLRSSHCNHKLPQCSCSLSFCAVAPRVQNQSADCEAPMEPSLGHTHTTGQAHAGGPLPGPSSCRSCPRKRRHWVRVPSAPDPSNCAGLHETECGGAEGTLDQPIPCPECGESWPSTVCTLPRGVNRKVESWSIGFT